MTQTKTIFAVCLALLAASAVSVQGAAVASAEDTGVAPNQSIGNALKSYFEAYEKMMSCGYEPLKIPVMAPYTIPYYEYNFSSDYYSLTGSVTDMVITGLNKFRVLGISNDDDNNRITFDLIYPEIHMLGEYTFNAWAEVAGFRTSMAGEGLNNIKLIDYRTVGELTWTTDSDGNISTDLKIHYYIGDISVENLNTDLDMATNRFINRWSREFTLMWFSHFEINDSTGAFTDALFPNLKSSLSTESFADYLSSQAQAFSSVECN